NNGAPFQEQEFCIAVGGPMNPPAICNVTCSWVDQMMGKPGACPGRWTCQPFAYTCLMDTDCGGGTTCVGAMPNANPPIPGRCKWRQGGMKPANCPNMTELNVPGGPLMVTPPRCVALGNTGDMFCVASYNCMPPQQQTSRFPSNCFQ